jgi:hypothetical protein
MYEINNLIHAFDSVAGEISISSLEQDGVFVEIMRQNPSLGNVKV